MNKYKSFLAPWMESFVAFQKAAGRWNKTYCCNLTYFDRHCSQRPSGHEGLTQELVDSWCAQRPSEINNSCRTRIFAVFNFIRYLRERGLTDVATPVMPGRERITHLGTLKEKRTSVIVGKQKKCSTKVSLSEAVYRTG